MSERCKGCERLRAKLEEAEDALLHMTRLHSNVSRMLMDAEQELKRFRANGQEALRGYSGALLDQLAERANDGRSGRCGIRMTSDHWCVLDYGHEGGHR